MSIKRFINEENGVLVTDSIISILIILIFAGVILTLITNITLESTKVKINSQEIDFATEILEYAEKLPYEQVTASTLISYVNNKNLANVKAGETIDGLTTPYKIAISVEKYGDDTKLDIIRIVKLKITANLENKNYETEMSMLKKANMEEVQQILENANI